MKNSLLSLKLGAMLLLVLAIISIPSSAQEEPPARELKFGIITTESSDNLSTLWTPFLKDMGEMTGLKIKPFFAANYSGIIEAMRFGEVEVAWLSNKSGLEALRRSNGEVFAKATYPDGAPGYHSVLLVPKDSPFQTVEDILKCDKTVNFGMGDPNSTSGTLMPMAYIFAPNGIVPTECFKNVRNATHEANGLTVANNLLDVATNNTTNLKRLARTRPEILERVRVIWTSPLIQTDPIIWRKDVPVEVKEKLLYFFMTYGRRAENPAELQRQREILGELDFGTFLPANDSHLDPIIRLEMVRDMAFVRSDRSISEDERTDQLAVLQAKLNEMQEAEDAEIVKPKGTPAYTDDSLRAPKGLDIPWSRVIFTLTVGLIAFGFLLWSSARRGAGPATPLKDRLFNASVWAIFIAALVWAYVAAEIFKAPLLIDNSDRMGEYASGFLKIDFKDGGLYLQQMSVTIQIALWGTFLSVIAAIPLGLLSAHNVAPTWIVFPVRRLMDAFRSINELVIGTMFVVTVGLGPFAGVMALAIHTTGVLAKLFSEAVEAMDPGPVEGVRATGAKSIHEVVWGVIPQVAPLWTSYALYRFESNTRSATILGLIGAGGIGQLLFEQINSFQYGKTAAILLIIIVAVTMVDFLSQVLRKRLM
ncbi:MAG: phosphonate ABC transporter, permease protein PhnE [Robiginitomaculum sp.]|nr:phosphonate ABC transporter, permease protein PhnE [Robiginitomaculum sp.]